MGILARELFDMFNTPNITTHRQSAINDGESDDHTGGMQKLSFVNHRPGIERNRPAWDGKLKDNLAPLMEGDEPTVYGLLCFYRRTFCQPSTPEQATYLAAVVESKGGVAGPHFEGGEPGERHPVTSEAIARIGKYWNDCRTERKKRQAKKDFQRQTARQLAIESLAAAEKLFGKFSPQWDDAAVNAMSYEIEVDFN